MNPRIVRDDGEPYKLHNGSSLGNRFLPRRVNRLMQAAKCRCGRLVDVDVGGEIFCRGCGQGTRACACLYYVGLAWFSEPIR